MSNTQTTIDLLNLVDSLQKQLDQSNADRKVLADSVRQFLAEYDKTGSSDCWDAVQMLDRILNHVK